MLKKTLFVTTALLFGLSTVSFAQTTPPPVKAASEGGMNVKPASAEGGTNVKKAASEGGVAVVKP